VGVSVWVGDDPVEIGTASFLKSFFSTVLVRLEDEEWGSRFPTIMRDFYSGRMSFERAEAAIAELETIHRMLKEYAPDQGVWDYEHRERRPPWEGNLSPSIRDLAGCFVTSWGKSLFNVLTEAFRQSSEKRQEIRIR